MTNRDDGDFPAILRRIRNDFAGARASGEIPVGERLINRWITDGIAASDALESVHVQLRPDSEIIARVRLRKPRLAPAVVASARIERQAELPARPVIEFRWAIQGLGRLGLVAGWLTSTFTALPPGLAVHGDRLTVNLAQILNHLGLGDFLADLTSLHIAIREGTAMVSFALDTRTLNS